MYTGSWEEYIMPDSVHMLVWFWVLLLWGLVFGIFCRLVVLVFFSFFYFFSPVSFWVFLKKKMGLSSALCLYSLPCSLVWRAAGCKPEMYDYPNGGLISMSGECEDIEGRKKKPGSGTQAAQLFMRVFWKKGPVLPVQVAKVPSLYSFVLCLA